MVTEEKTLEEMIVDNVHTIVEKIEQISSCFVEYNVNTIDVLIIKNKIIRIKNIICLSELEFEYQDNKQFVNEKINKILDVEDSILQIIKEKGVDSTEIVSRLKTIRNYIEQLEEKIFKMFDFFIINGNKNDIRNHIRMYKQQLTIATQEITKEKEQIISDFKIENEKIKKEQLDLKLKNEEFNSLLSTKISELDKNINDKIIESDKLIEEKRKEISDLKQMYSEDLENMKIEYIDKFNELKKNAEEQFEKLHKNIIEKDEKISKLIGLIGNKANIGEYKTNADNAHSERIKWQIATIVIFGIAFILMLVITFCTKDYNLATIAKYIVSVILLGMSGYTAKQAGNQRKDEIYFRKQQLELSSIDVYLDDMPDDKKQKIKEDLSNKIFGQASETYNSKYDDSANTTIDKISKLIENMSNTIAKK